MNNNLTKNPFLSAEPKINWQPKSAPFSEEIRVETAAPQKPEEEASTTLETNNAWSSYLGSPEASTSIQFQESTYSLAIGGQRELNNFQEVKQEVNIEFIENPVVTDLVQNEAAKIVIETEQEISGGWVEAVAGEVLPIAQKFTPRLFSGLFGALGIVFELFVGKTLGFDFAQEKALAKPKKEAKREPSSAKAKEDEKGKKPKFKLGSFTFTPRPHAPMEEIVYTDKMNDFHEAYMGVLDNEGKISAYHKANAEKKELESKAAQIASERALKIKSGRGKTPAGFDPREGELLMGTENPSHFTKALG